MKRPLRFDILEGRQLPSASLTGVAPLQYTVINGQIVRDRPGQESQGPHGINPNLLPPAQVRGTTLPAQNIAPTSPLNAHKIIA